MKLSLFAVAAIAAIASHANAVKLFGNNTSHTQILLQPYNEDGTAREPVPLDLSPQDPNTKEVELWTDARIIGPGEKPLEVGKPGQTQVTMKSINELTLLTLLSRLKTHQVPGQSRMF